MFLRTFLATMALALPAWAQAVAVPDCTVEVTVAKDLKLDVLYRCRSATALTFAPDDQEVAAHVSGNRGKVEPVNGLVEMRYRSDLADYARAVNSPAAGVKRGEAVLAPIPAWLLEPRGFERLPVIDIRAQLPEGFAFATGLPKAGDAWRLAGTRVGFAGYSAIGRFTLEEIAVPAPGSLRPGAAKEDGVLRLAILDGFAKGSTPDLVDWVRRTAQAESNYWQGFTAKQMLVGLVPVARAGVGYGRTVSGGGATVMVEVGAQIDRRRLFDAWVLVHELIHTGMPYVRGRGTWLMEGAATYIEPIIRARAGWKTEEEVWKEWVDDMPQGARAFANGLANASGRENYWAGAIFMLMADIGIRRVTGGAKGLEDCLAGALWNGLDAQQTVQVTDYAAACDRASGTKTVGELVERYYRGAQPVDLAAFWKELGVALVGGRIVLDDSAPQARWRKMIVFGPAGVPLKTVKLPWEVMKGAWLEDLTWLEAKARFDAGAVVVIPVGAASKAHGPHLPLKTDALTARALGQGLIERLPVVAAPVLGFGFYPAFTSFAGSQHLSADTFKTVVRELIGNFTAHGVRRIALINTGVSTEKPLDEVAKETDVLVLHMRLLGQAAESLIEHKDGGHADERETSVMLALDPRSVRMDKLTLDGPFEQTGATGDPTRATAFKGERLMAARLDDLVATLCRRWPDLEA